MLEKSALVTHPSGNRRYKNWVFQVSGTKVESISPYTVGIASKNEVCPACGGAGYHITYDVCAECHGDGCDVCGGSGDIKSKYTCGYCANNKS